MKFNNHAPQAAIGQVPALGAWSAGCILTYRILTSYPTQGLPRARPSQELAIFLNAFPRALVSLEAPSAQLSSLTATAGGENAGGDGGERRGHQKAGRDQPAPEGPGGIWIIF